LIDQLFLGGLSRLSQALLPPFFKGLSAHIFKLCGMGDAQGLDFFGLRAGFLPICVETVVEKIFGRLTHWHDP